MTRRPGGSGATVPEVDEDVIALGQAAPGLRLLLLVGSRARADAHPRSDTDLAFLADRSFDVSGFRAALTRALGTDAVDLVDLATASAVFRFGAVRDGVVLFEHEPGIAERFAIEVSIFWCDVEPVLRRAHEAVLASLPAT